MIPLKVIYVFFVKRVGLDGIVMANISVDHLLLYGGEGTIEPLMVLSFPCFNLSNNF